MKFVLPIASAFALAVAATPATAATVFNTVLSGANESTPNPSTATGLGTLILSTDQNTVNIFLQWAGLTGPAIGAHIHCCAAQGANGPVAIDFGPPALATGSLTRTYDLTLLATYTTGFVTANGGNVGTARTAFLNGLNAGRTYYNVHTQVYQSGEIRGQLNAVPEPATWGMMIAGFGIVGGAMRMRRRQVAAA